MYEIKEEDLQLSEKFKEAQFKLQENKKELIQVSKKANNDTIEALLLFQSNSAYFKDVLKNQKMVDKQALILKELIKTFPKADKKVLLITLIKNGYLNYNQYNSIFVILYTFIFIVLNTFIFITKGLAFDHFFQYTLPSLCIIICISVLVDNWIINKK